MCRRALMVGVVVLAAAGCGAGQPRVATPTPSIQSGPVVLPLASVESRVAGQPVVYLFTAPGCASCATEARDLTAAAKGRPGVQLVGVDLSRDQPADFATYVGEIGIDWTRFLWTVDADGSLARRYGVVELSSTVLIGGDGKVRFVNAGAQDAATLAGQISRLV